MKTANNNRGRSREKRRHRRYGVVITVCFSLLAGGWLLGYRQAAEYPLSVDARDGGYVLPTSSSMEELESRAAQSAVRIQINARPEFDYQSGSCNLMLGNPAENTRNLQVSVTRKETGEKLYQSEVLLPGQRIPYVALEPIPEPGEYVATAIFTVIDEESGTAVGEVEVEIILSASRPETLQAD